MAERRSSDLENLSRIFLGFIHLPEGVFSEMKTHLETLFYIAIALIVLAGLALMVAGCGTTQHRKEQLQLEHPLCEVTDDLEVLCEPPNANMNAWGDNDDKANLKETETKQGKKKTGKRKKK